MIVCLYTEADKVWSYKEQEKKLDFLPFSIKDRILSYQDPKDRQQRVNGKLLLRKLLQHFELSDKIRLEDIQYTTYNRPFFDSEFDFSTSHSGNISICAGTMTGMIGIDIELIKPLQVNDYRELFTDKEWNLIQESNDKAITFYTLWTKKEACLKAIGAGVALPFSAIDASSDIVNYEGEKYYLHPLKTTEGYIAHVATDITNEVVTINDLILL